MGKSYKKAISKSGGDRKNKKVFNRSLRRKMKQNVFGFVFGNNSEYKKQNNSYDIYDFIFKMSKTKEELVEKRIEDALRRYEIKKRTYDRIIEKSKTEPDIERKWEEKRELKESGDCWKYWKNHMTKEERYYKHNNKYEVFFLKDWGHILFMHNTFVDMYANLKTPKAPDLNEIRKEAIREWKKRTSK